MSNVVRMSNVVSYISTCFPTPTPDVHDLFVLLPAVWASSHSMKLPWETRLGAGSYPVIEVHFSRGSV